MTINRLDKKSRDYYIKTGEHYGYPKCCVEFFADGWIPVYLANDNGVRERYLNRMKKAGWDASTKWILCPECLKKVERKELGEMPFLSLKRG